MISLSDGRTELYQWDTDVKLNIPQGIAQVHFANNVYSRAFVIDVVNGQVTPPPELLQTDKPLKVWGFVPTESGGYTKIEKVFEVKRKNRPNDYVYTLTEQIKLTDAVATAEEAIKKAYEVEKKLNEGDFGGGGDGTNGEDGFSPIVQVVEISGGHRVSITDINGTKNFDVLNGTNGEDGEKGEQGERGEQGVQGEKGADGYTPVKGVDYWTITDKQEIVSEVLEQTPDTPSIHSEEWIFELEDSSTVTKKVAVYD